MTEPLSGWRGLNRRRWLQLAGSVAAGTAWSTVANPTLSAQTRTPTSNADITGRLARYMAAAPTRDLPPEVVREAKHRVIDALAAMVSGARLLPGQMALAYARTLGGTSEASIIASDLRTNVVNAALVNAMFAHADETDDAEPVTKSHPGSSAVPAALAMAEREGRSGTDLIRAVALGYDLGIRFLHALGPDHIRATHRSAEGTNATFCGLGAAAGIARLNEQQMRYAISYAAQQVSGLWSWVGDADHVEKAFDFAGMGARNGVTAVTMVQAGLTGVNDVLDGEHNMLIALSTQPKPEEMVAALGSRYFVAETAIKSYSVGYPIQAAADSFLALRREHRLTTDNVRAIRVVLPDDGARIVDNSAMPDVNCQYIIAVALIDGAVTFANSHARERMTDPGVVAVKEKVTLVGDRALMVPDAPRSARVEVTLQDGRTVSHFTRHPTGSKENPLTTDQVVSKARDLMTPVLGAARTGTLLDRLIAIEQVADVRELRPLLTA